MWKFREDMLGHYINGVSNRTFKDVENRINYLEQREKVLEPEPIMEDEWDCDSNELTGKQFQIQDERYDYAYKCISCGEKMFIDNYCSKCGQKLR